MKKNMSKIRTYSELIQIPSFEDRLKYLRMNSSVGITTFGFDRYLNQRFYNSSEWKKVRSQVIIRDNGCDLACADFPIYSKILVHHMNPITVDDISESTEFLMNPEYLITVSQDTHNSIHYQNGSSPIKGILQERKPGDTCPWKQ